MKKFETIVAGVNYKNPQGQSRQKIIKEYVKENYDNDSYDKDDYNYCPNSVIKEYEYDQLFRYELEELDTIKLKDEPENPYDSNAIAVIHKKMGHIGYIPRRDIHNINNFIKNSPNGIRIWMQLEGGPYKYYDILEDKVKSKSEKYYLKLILVRIENKKINNQIVLDYTDSSNQEIKDINLDHEDFYIEKEIKNKEKIENNNSDKKDSTSRIDKEKNKNSS